MWKKGRSREKKKNSGGTKEKRENGTISWFLRITGRKKGQTPFQSIPEKKTDGNSDIGRRRKDDTGSIVGYRGPKSADDVL